VTIDRSILWRAAAVQAIAVAALSIVLAVSLGKAFFQDWGWLAGPGAWLVCSLITARVLSLPLLRTVIGAALAGIPAGIAVLIGVHWLGTVLAVGLFALWCARAPRVPPRGIEPLLRA
jgi:hypothetical protein